MKKINVGLASLFFVLFSFSCVEKSDSSNAQTQKQASNVYHWKLVTAWPVGFPILSEAPKRFAQRLAELTDGQMDIKVYAAGELVPALEAFGAVSEGTVEMAHASPYYWAGKAPAAQFFSAVPFGMNVQQTTTWLLEGGGYPLWKKVYEPFGVIPFLGGNSGVQMGGWFRREINGIEDFKGLKMRMPGLGGRILQKAGCAAVLVAASEIYTSLERGVIDAADWVAPFHDHQMGLDKIATYYYYPGWQEPSAQLEFIVNKKAYEGLPKPLQSAIETVSLEVNAWVLTAFEKSNRDALQKMVKANVNLREFNQKTLHQLQKYTDEVLQEVASSDPVAQEVYDSYKKFQTAQLPWSAISEKVYYEKIAPKK